MFRLIQDLPTDTTSNLPPCSDDDYGPDPYNQMNGPCDPGQGGGGGTDSGAASNSAFTTAHFVISLYSSIATTIVSMLLDFCAVIDDKCMGGTEVRHAREIPSVSFHVAAPVYNVLLVRFVWRRGTEFKLKLKRNPTAQQ